jgi:hypothetical protein
MPLARAVQQTRLKMLARRNAIIVSPRYVASSSKTGAVENRRFKTPELFSLAQIHAFIKTRLCLQRGLRKYWSLVQSPEPQ